MTARLSCLVPFCRRTTAAGRFNEWICAKHWPLVSTSLKARKRRALAVLRKAHARGRDVAKFRHRADVIWAACKAQAVERAMGISA